MSPALQRVACLPTKAATPPTGEAWLHEIKHDGFRVRGEAVCCGDDGVPSFDRIRYRRHDASVFLYAFDLIELDGDDLRREPLETRKTTLASLLRCAAPPARSSTRLTITAQAVRGEKCHKRPFHSDRYWYSLGDRFLGSLIRSRSKRNRRYRSSVNAGLC